MSLVQRLPAQGIAFASRIIDSELQYCRPGPISGL